MSAQRRVRFADGQLARLVGVWSSAACHRDAANGKVTAARALFDLAKVRSPEEHDVHER